MRYIFLASVSYTHFAIIGNAVLYFVAGLEAVAVAFFLGAGCSLLYFFVAVVVVERIALLRRDRLFCCSLANLEPEVGNWERPWPETSKR